MKNPIDPSVLQPSLDFIIDPDIPNHKEALIDYWQFTRSKINPKLFLKLNGVRDIKTKYGISGNHWHWWTAGFKGVKKCETCSHPILRISSRDVFLSSIKNIEKEHLRLSSELTQRQCRECYENEHKSKIKLASDLAFDQGKHLALSPLVIWGLSDSGYNYHLYRPELESSGLVGYYPHYDTALRGSDCAAGDKFMQYITNYNVTQGATIEDFYKSEIDLEGALTGLNTETLNFLLVLCRRFGPKKTIQFNAMTLDGRIETLEKSGLIFKNGVGKFVVSEQARAYFKKNNLQQGASEAILSKSEMELYRKLREEYLFVFPKVSWNLIFENITDPVRISPKDKLRIKEEFVIDFLITDQLMRPTGIVITTNEELSRNILGPLKLIKKNLMIQVIQIRYKDRLRTDPYFTNDKDLE